MNEEIKKIRIEDYNYPLPDERIARFPLAERDSSKLLVAGAEGFADAVFRDIVSYLPQDSLVIFNETKVIQARLFFPLSETRNIEIFCLQPAGNLDIQQAMSRRNTIDYECLVGGAKKWKTAKLALQLQGGGVLYAEKMSRENAAFTIRFNWNTSHTFAEVLEKAGKTPLPPYLKRAAGEEDRTRYQTVFARNDGSVAAPTASLHFTENILAKLSSKGIEQAKLTLHVGAGTFKPVDSDEIGHHSMHAEEMIISMYLVEYILQNIHRSIIPVGTTAMRALESIYWLGCMASEGQLQQNKPLDIPQWLPYEWNKETLPETAFESLLSFMKNNNISDLHARTSVMIAPGYKHRLCSGLITNFHQPGSTLLLLIASLLGEKWKAMYQHALQNHYRFLSYGDACFIKNRFKV